MRACAQYADAPKLQACRRTASEVLATLSSQSELLSPLPSREALRRTVADGRGEPVSCLKRAAMPAFLVDDCATRCVRSAPRPLCAHPLPRASDGHGREQAREATAQELLEKLSDRGAPLVRLLTMDCLDPRLYPDFEPPFMRVRPPVMQCLDSEVSCCAPSCASAQLRRSTAAVALPQLIARICVGQHHVC